MSYSQRTSSTLAAALWTACSLSLKSLRLVRPFFPTAPERVIMVDTTPPDVNAIVKVVIEGTVEPGSRVFVDGRAVGVDPFGNWRVELTVKKGKTSVEVVAIDANGNKKTERRSLFQ